MLTVKSSLISVEDRGRKAFSNIAELAESIKKHGLIHPIVVDKTGDSYKLIAGERRLRACLLAGIIDIPITLREDTAPIELKELELEENLLREDLHWTERTAMLLSLDELKREQHTGSKTPVAGHPTGWTTQDTADLVNEKKSTVGNDIKLARDMRDNPEEARKIAHLPKDMARKRMKVLLKEKHLKKTLKEKGVSTSYSLKLISCLDGIKAIQDNSIDLVITDPPYAIETINQVGVSTHTHYASESTNMGSEGEMEELYCTLFPELFRVLHNGSHLYIFHAMGWYTRLHFLLKHAGFEPDEVPLIWDKGLTTAKPKDWHYMPSYEAITFAIKPPKGRPLMKPCSNILRVPPIHSSKRAHPLQKPRELLSILIENSSSIGETILDPFAGSGSTLDAANSLHRRSIGFEIDEGNYLRARAFLERDQNEQNNR